MIEFGKRIDEAPPTTQRGVQVPNRGLHGFRLAIAGATDQQHHPRHPGLASRELADPASEPIEQVRLEDCFAGASATRIKKAADTTSAVASPIKQPAGIR
jgi:hypothetical protein